MKNILIPVDWQSQDVHLADYAKAFEHIDNKKFSAFFLEDFLQHSERETAAAEADRLDFRFEIEKEARALDVDLQFWPIPKIRSHFVFKRDLPIC